MLTVTVIAEDELYAPGSQGPDDASLPARLIRLAAHQAAIRRCTRCVEAGFIPEAWPVFHGSADRRVMVVGQAPALRRVERPLPYSGASGRTLRGWLARAGFEPEALHERFYLTSLTKCFPGPSRSGKGDRPPSAAERALCRSHLEGELELLRPDVILALGRIAATFFVGDRPLDQLVGHTFDYRGAVVFPLPHPSGVSRWLNDLDNQALLDRSLSRLAEVRLERGL